MENDVAMGKKVDFVKISLSLLSCFVTVMLVATCYYHIPRIYKIDRNSSIEFYNTENVSAFWRRKWFSEQINVINSYDFIVDDPTDYHLTLESKQETDEYNKNAKRLKTKLVEINHAIVGSAGYIALDPYHIWKPEWKHPEVKFGIQKKMMHGKIIGHYENVISVGYYWCSRNFGHSLEDFYTPLSLIPLEVRKTAYVVVFAIPFLDPILDCLEVPKDHRIRLKDYTWIACDKLYTFYDRMFMLNNYANATYTLKQIIHAKLNLSSIQSSQYCFSNRPFNKTRHIHNLDEIINAAKAKWPNIQWIFVTDDHKDVVSCAKAWKSIKFMFCPDGSNVCKCIFMADRTALICVTSGYPEWSIAQFCAGCRIFELQYHGLQGSHHRGKGSPIDVEVAVQQIERGLYALEHKSWKPL